MATVAGGVSRFLCAAAAAARAGWVVLLTPRPTAIGFSYFETLINGGNRAQVEAEKQRVVALNSYIETVGAVSMYLFQDMADETMELFQRILDQFDDRERALAELLDTFNDAGMANSILYHLRLLASSWLKGNSETYLPFITLDSGVAGYSAEVIERPNVEIDHMGIQLLVNVLLKPAGFVLEVAYLDRSPGSQVNTYRFPDEANVQHASELGPVIHLLYRPDHYDILYPTNPNLQPASPPSALDMQQPVDLQVHRVGFSSAYEINNTPTALHYGGADLHANPLALIPGFDSPPGLNTVLNLGTGSPISPYSPSPASPWMPTGFTDPIRQVPQAPITVPTPTPPAQTNHPLRFSEYCQLPEYVGNNTWKEPTFQTSTFKNSHFNVAHYNNPNFQPEEYKPEADEYDLPLRGGSRKRGSV